MAISAVGFTAVGPALSGPVHAALPRSRPLAQADARRVCTVSCSGDGAASEDPPKLEPFSQTRLSRSMRERRLLQKAEDALNEKCMTLDGEPAYQCWQALFDYETMMEEAETECLVDDGGGRVATSCEPLERLERIVRQSGGVNSLIDNVRMVARIRESKKPKEAPDEEQWLRAVADAVDEVADAEPEQGGGGQQRHEFLVPEDGGIPKTMEELQDEIGALLPESSFSRVLKRRGHHSEA